jgi:DNA-binding transcriptional regulator LsrR (DeoR family)
MNHVEHIIKKLKWHTGLNQVQIAESMGLSKGYFTKAKADGAFSGAFIKTIRRNYPNLFSTDELFSAIRELNIKQ